MRPIMYGDNKITIVLCKMKTQFQSFRNIIAQSGRFTVALALASTLLTGCKGENLNQESPQLQKARKLIEAGNFEAAFVMLNQALNEAPKDPNVHLNLGWLYLYTDDIPSAEKELAKAESLGPDLAETYHLKGSLLNYRARHEKSPKKTEQLEQQAIEQFRQAISRDVGNDQTYFDLATSLTAINRNEEALEVLDKGFDYIPAKDLETQVNFQIASCAAHAKLQLFEEAVQDCEQALRFTTNPASRERIEDMIQNMKLMNPGLSKRLEDLKSPPPPEDSNAKQAEENAVINDSASD